MHHSLLKPAACNLTTVQTNACVITFELIHSSHVLHCYVAVYTPTRVYMLLGCALQPDGAPTVIAKPQTFMLRFC